jgi:crotonobetainyl-CoA:carnitine CoA-transferase CaiB-like acyl-CoA transferase
VLKVSDDIWNDVGRPASDAALSILFPGGASFYVDGDVTQQPDKMDLLVQLLQVNIHPKLSDTVRLASIATVQTESAALRAAVTAATTVQTKLELLKQMERAVATAAAIELANYKRLLKANGYTEAEAHKIIPDHNAPSPKPKGAAPAAPAAPPPAAPPPAPPAPTPPATPPDPNNPNG